MAGLSLFLLAACAGIRKPVPDSLPPDFLPGSSPGSGLVVGSVTSLPDPDLGWQAFSRYEFERVGDPKVFGSLISGSNNDFGKLAIPFAYKQYPPDWDGCALDGLKEGCGRLFAMELPAGDYAITLISSPAVQDGGSFWGPLGRQPEGYRFSVASGEITYLGNLNSRICVGYIKFISYGHVITAASGEVQDQFERDWPLLVSKYPFLADRAVRQRVIEGMPWRIRRGENNREPWVPEYGWEGCDREARESGWPGLPE